MKSQLWELALTKKSRLRVVPHFLGLLFTTLIFLGFAIPARGGPSLEQQVSRLFVGHAVTLRNFYRGNSLLYGSAGQLLSKSEPGYYSRDGMVEITSVKLSKDNELIMLGKRVCLELDPEKGQLDDVWTGDKIEIRVRLGSSQPDFTLAVRVLQRVFFTSQDNLASFVPPYWRNCLQQRLVRLDKHSLWECPASDKRLVPEFAVKKLSWDVPPVPPDDTLHNGMQMYLLKHRVCYLWEQGMVPPRVLSAPDPVFQWIQRRAKLLDMTIVLSFTVDTEGKSGDITVVSPVGMGMDEQAAEKLAEWRFQPGKCNGQPCAVHARVYFDIKRAL